jgi:signal transduction histidine kinase
LAADALLSLVLLGLVIGVRRDGGHVPDGITQLAVVLGCGALVVRRRYPMAVWAGTLGLAVLGLVSAGGLTPAVVPPVLGLYTLASLRPRRVAVLSAVATGGVLGVTVVLVLGSTWASPEPWAVVAWSGMPAAIGDAVRSQRAIVAAARERAASAEATREEEAQRRVAEERLHIARELHDVVAHHIAVITVQAGVAGHLLDTDPAQAREALDHVRSAGQTVLREMGTILGVLRDRPDEDRHPAPGLAGVDELVVEARRAGLAVTLRVSGTPGTLAPVVDLAAHRLVQESLSNARKHGSGSAVLSVAHTPGLVTIDVTNLVPAGRPASSPGYGLAGMQERVSTAGGLLEVGPTKDGRFQVHAELPVVSGQEGSAS